MAQLISRAAYSRLAGISDAAVSKLCKGRLAPACVGKRIDVDHPAARAHLAEKGKSAPAPMGSPPAGAVRSKPPPPLRPRPDKSAAEKAPKPTTRRPPEPKVAPPEDEPLQQVTKEDIERYAHLSLTALTKRFGTATAFRDWLTAHKAIEDIREKRLKNDEAEGRLIPREPVKVHIFGAIDAVLVRLLRDAPKTIARRLYALAKSEAPVEQAEATTREILSSLLKPVKANAARVLRNAGKVGGESGSEQDDEDGGARAHS